MRDFYPSTNNQTLPQMTFNGTFDTITDLNNAHTSKLGEETFVRTRSTSTSVSENVGGMTELLNKLTPIQIESDNKYLITQPL
jgi:hypothetical protein